jgi:hypothetical protein
MEAVATGDWPDLLWITLAVSLETSKSLYSEDTLFLALSFAKEESFN